MRVTRPFVLPILVPLAATAVVGVPLATAAAGPADPQAILKEASANLAKVSSYHVDATATDDDGVTRFSADVSKGGRAELVIHAGKGGTVHVRKLPSATYLRGNAAYWKEVSDGDSSASRKLAGRWIKVAKSGAKEFASAFAEVAPKHLAKCLVSPGSTGTLTLGAPTTVGGVRAQVLVDAGDKPGTSPGKLFVAATGTVLPLRALQTGKAQPGGPTNACQSGDDTSTASDVRFSRYGKKLRLTTPKNALDLSKEQGGSSSAPTI